MAAHQINAEAIIFIRQLERQLEKVRDDAAGTLMADTIENLAFDAAAGKRPVLENVEKSLRKGHALAIDRVALGQPGYNRQAVALAFNGIWAKLGLKALVKPHHHADIIQAIKLHFLDELEARLDIANKDERAKIVSDINYEYHQKRTEYYLLLRDEHVHKKFLTEDKLKYNLGYEVQRLKNEVANKKAEQKFLTGGLSLAQYFAFSQGFFAAGGLYLLAAGFHPLLGIVGGILAAPLFYFVSRSNWLTIDLEMGPLLKDLFYNPAHALLSLRTKIKYWFKHSEFSWRSFVNTLKGSTNLIAASFIGILTLVGANGFLGLLTGWAPLGPALNLISLGMAEGGSTAFLLSGTWPVFLIAASLLLTATLVYFVITNIFQLPKNAGKDGAEEHDKKLEALRTIDDKPWWHLHKRYGFNIKVAITGISATLIGASALLLTVFETGITHVPSFFGGIIPAMPIPLALIITGVIVLASIYGISSFYQKRTRGSTERLITNSIGLTNESKTGAFDKLQAKADVTGLDVPDFQAQANGDNVVPTWKNPLKYVWYKLFNTDPDDDNSERARISNSVGQGIPALAGGSMLFTTVFMMYDGASKLAATVAGFVTGAFAGLLAASWASYSANSVGMRKIKYSVTELEVMNRDKIILDTEARIDENDPAYQLGVLKAETEIYITGRQRQVDRQIDHYGVQTSLAPNFNKYDGNSKVDAANSMMTQLDEHIENKVVVRGTTVNYLYQAARDKVKTEGADRKILNASFNPLTEGRLGEIANEAARVIARRS